MDHGINPNWIVIDKSILDEFTKSVDCFRDGWSDGIAYYIKSTKEEFAFLSDKGKVFVDPEFIEK